MKTLGKFRHWRSLGCFFVWLWLLAAPAGFAADSPTIYQTWIKPWTDRPLTSPALGDVPLKLVVSIITGEADANSDQLKTPADRLSLAYRIKVTATEVATNGACRSYLISNTGADSTSPRQLSSEATQKLDALVAHLPDDGAQLPLAGRRVVVQTVADGKWQVRVYDGRKLPPEVKALLDQLANPYAAQL